jgi:hypothetical protein
MNSYYGESMPEMYQHMPVEHRNQDDVLAVLYELIRDNRGLAPREQFNNYGDLCDLGQLESTCLWLEEHSPAIGLAAASSDHYRYKICQALLSSDPRIAGIRGLEHREKPMNKTDKRLTHWLLSFARYRRNNLTSKAINLTQLRKACGKEAIEQQGKRLISLYSNLPDAPFY